MTPLQLLDQRIRELVPSLPQVPKALPLPVEYDGMMYFFGKDPKVGDAIVADIDMTEGFADGFRIRGWGRIQYMKEEGKTPEQLQDEVAYYIADAINAYSEIKLHHVLQAIQEKVKTKWLKTTFPVETLSNYQEYLEKTADTLLKKWKLEVGLNGQPNECIEFLLSILK